MYKIYKPAIYTKDVLSINYKKLKDQGIRGIIFDIDNTIVKCKDKYPNEKIKECKYFCLTYGKIYVMFYEYAAQRGRSLSFWNSTKVGE